MTKKEFLKQQTNDVFENFEKHGSYPPTFAILYDDGSTKSIGTSFNGPMSKDGFDLLMRKICENPRVIASTFTCEAWISKTSKIENKRPSDCKDKETAVFLVYTTRDNIEEFHLYKPNHQGKLELVDVFNEFGGRFCNPFNTAKTLTKSEKEQAIFEFQESVRNSLCQAYKELQYIAPMLIFLSNSSKEISVRWIPDEEWMDKDGLKRKTNTQCQDPQTLAFLLAFPVESNMVNMLLVSEENQEVFTYGIDNSTVTLKFISKEPYKGEFSGYFQYRQINSQQNQKNYGNKK